MQTRIETNNPTFDGSILTTRISRNEFREYEQGVGREIVNQTVKHYVAEHYDQLISEIDPRRLMKLVEKEVARMIAERSVRDYTEKTK